jgi:uncharacterized protein (TIGR03083 family)
LSNYNATIDETTTWKLIHQERATLADALDELSGAQWAAPSLCAGWTVQVAAGHVMAGAEQTRLNFVRAMAANGFRFNTMIDRVARRSGQLTPAEIIARLRARTTTTNGPPAPALTMLGEVVVHGADILRPLGIAGQVAPEALAGCLTMYTKVSFPVGTKKRIAGLKLVATDIGWSYGSGPEVSGPGEALMLAMTGRKAGLGELSGDGLGTLRARMDAAS